MFLRNVGKLVSDYAVSRDFGAYSAGSLERVNLKHWTTKANKRRLQAAQMCSDGDLGRDIIQSYRQVTRTVIKRLKERGVRGEEPNPGQWQNGHFKRNIGFWSRFGNGTVQKYRFREEKRNCGGGD
jgi:hypothetical protein